MFHKEMQYDSYNHIGYTMSKPFNLSGKVENI